MNLKRANMEPEIFHFARLIQNQRLQGPLHVIQIVLKYYLLPIFM